MNNFFYARLAANNIKKNAQIYIPYIITCVITIAFYYIMKSLSLNEGLNGLIGASSITYTMELGCNIIMVFAVIFLFYTNSFLIKRREKEFGLFHILGMEKKHLMRVILIETVYIAFLSIGAGFLFGIALDKVMYLVILRILDTQIPLGFYVSKEAIFSSIRLFCIIFFLIFGSTLWKLKSAKPVELLRGGNVGEKEPKAKWFLAILGAGSLGAGYYLAVTVENPVTAISVFFVAVLLVILGTYLLFAAGSIVFLKILRANKRYYYQTRHFIGISGMLYRMKQNAVGLANICILSTMVLVMISSTASLMIGVKDVIYARYPYDIAVYGNEKRFGEIDDEAVRATVAGALTDNGLVTEEEMEYQYLIITAFETENGFTIKSGNNMINTLSEFNELCFITLDQYNQMTGDDKQLADGEIILSSNRKEMDKETFKLDDFEYKIAERLDEFPLAGEMAANIANTCLIVLKTPEELDHIYQWQSSIYGGDMSSIHYMYGVNLKGETQGIIRAYQHIAATLKEAGEEQFDGWVECRESNRQDFYAIYGGLFFIGIFLGLLFTVAAILMIYYKQITEGYYDRDRYVIMQNVGMSQRDVKASIRSQILTVFFLPLVMSGIHIVFAYPLVKKIMIILNLTNTSLFLWCTIGCFVAFTLLYVVVYVRTAKLYYHIVKK